MTIRAGAVDDIPAVLPLVARTIAFHQQLDPARFSAVPNAHQRYEAWLQRTIDNPEGAFFVAEENGSVVGFVLGQVQEEYAMYVTGRYGMIHELWVEPEWRRQGIARQLMLAALELFRQLGVHQARLDSATANTAAQRLFAACGFRPSMTEMLAELQPPTG